METYTQYTLHTHTYIYTRTPKFQFEFKISSLVKSTSLFSGPLYLCSNSVSVSEMVQVQHLLPSLIIIIPLSYPSPPAILHFKTVRSCISLSPSLHTHLHSLMLAARSMSVCVCVSLASTNSLILLNLTLEAWRDKDEGKGVVKEENDVVDGRGALITDDVHQQLAHRAWEILK